mgnify:FL=1
MKKFLILFLISAAFVLYGCNHTNSNPLTGSAPPNVYVVNGNKKDVTELGSYCWKSGGNGICADTAGPVELLKGVEPITVDAGTTISLQMDFTPKPSEVSITQIHDGKESRAAAQGSRFNAPGEKGIYHYSYQVWWMDEKEEALSHGDASYAFVLEIK